MFMFIKVHDDRGQTRAINVDHITLITPRDRGRGSEIHVDHAAYRYVECTESPEQILLDIQRREELAAD